mgnify:CR=1 FL=1
MVNSAKAAKAEAGQGQAAPLEPLDLLDLRAELSEEETLVQDTVARFVDDRLLCGHVFVPLALDVLVDAVGHLLAARIDLAAGRPIDRMKFAPLGARRAKNLLDASIVGICPIVRLDERLELLADAPTLLEVVLAALRELCEVLPTRCKCPLGRVVEAVQEIVDGTHRYWFEKAADGTYLLARGTPRRENYIQIERYALSEEVLDVLAPSAPPVACRWAPPSHHRLR